MDSAMRRFFRCSHVFTWCNQVSSVPNVLDCVYRRGLKSGCEAGGTARISLRVSTPDERKKTVRPNSYDRGGAGGVRRRSVDHARSGDPGSGTVGTLSRGGYRTPWCVFLSSSLACAP